MYRRLALTGQWRLDFHPIFDHVLENGKIALTEST